MTRKTKTKSTSRSKSVARPKQTGITRAEVNQIVNAAAARYASKMPSKQNTWLGDLGMAAGNGISKVFGLGAYRISKNSLYDSSTGQQVPFMHSTNESLVFRHREYIRDISSSVAFTNSTFTINPGDPLTFPYLSNMAACFQEYKFRGLVFSYKSTSAVSITNGTNTSMGTVSMMAQYKADASAPTNKQEMLNSMWAVDGRPSECIILPIECAPKENPIAIQYIRNGPVTGDVKMYDLATVHVATNGMAAANPIGELWVSYEVEFFKPRLPEVGGLLSTYHATRSDTAGNAYFGAVQIAVETAAPFVQSVASNVITFTPGVSGRFLISCYHQGTAVAVAAGTPTLANCTGVLWFNNNANDFVHSPGLAVVSNTFWFGNVIEIPGNSPLSATLTYAAGIFPTTSTIDVVITELDAEAD
jgi:hypothetical protein